MKLLIISLIYLLAAFCVKIFRGTNKRSESLPIEYRREFDVSTREISKTFDKGEEIPQNTVTLFIVGYFRTNNKTVQAVDYLANLFTFGWLRFNEILPVGYPLNLRIYFKNISKNNLGIEETTTRFFIKYPEEGTSSRNWPMKIPSLKQQYESCFEVSENFFTPEVAGTHELIIEGIQNVRCAGPYGVCGRKYRMPVTGGIWRLSFHVSGGYEYKVFIIAFLALAVSLILLLLTVMEKL